VKYRKSDLDAFLQRRTRGGSEAEVISNALHPSDEVDQSPKSRTNPPGSLSEQRQASVPKRYRRSQGRSADPLDFSLDLRGTNRNNDEHQRTEDKRYRRRK
jgi:hypothetical protein